MNDTFNLRRIKLLIYKDFRELFCPKFIIYLTLLIIFVFSTVLYGMNSTPDIRMPVYVLVLWLIFWHLCVLTASSSFLALYDKSQNERFLLLPASTFEKVLVRMLGILIAFPIFVFALMVLAIVLSETLIWISSAPTHERTFINPLNIISFKGLIDKGLIEFWLLQSIFSLGAVWFKRAHFIKTVLAIMVILIATTGLTYLFLTSPIHADIPLVTLADTKGIVTLCTYVVAIILSWLIIWRRIRETESHHGF